ncbi:MAG: D-glycero-beta-D-manno-heptose 1-phosphate adenylyltransferase [SAR324 cluster bacterium]|nr:D-glycero-beta-D-manno-heptose 1-phosphate adenylyltransferase [SAR324 cluster bacterium]
MGKILAPLEFCKLGKKLALQGSKLVFTNGCFDILHAGHAQYLSQARYLGDYLFLAINSDESVRGLKGDKRPINKLDDRMLILAYLSFVDYITYFNEDTPIKLISDLLPSVLVKGGDWLIHDIVGHDVVKNNGGQVFSLPFMEGKSTSNVIDNILIRHGKGEKS